MQSRRPLFLAVAVVIVATPTVAISGAPPAIKWTYDAGGEVGSPALAPDGTIYAFVQTGSPRAQIIAVNPDGSQKRDVSVDTASSFPPTIRADGYFYVVSGRDILLVDADPVEGAEVLFTASADIRPSIVLAQDGTLYFGTTDALVAVAADGVKRWEFPVTNGANYPSVSPDGTIYFDSGEKIVALTPEGLRKWAFPSGGYFGHAAIGRDLAVYVAVSGKLYALEPESVNPNGTKRWEYDGTSDRFAPVIDRRGNIYVIVAKALHAVSPEGTKIWEFQLGDNVTFSSAAIDVDGTIYIGSEDQNLYAINPDGSLKWFFATGGQIQSAPVIGADGTIFFGSNDDKLYALEGASGSRVSPWATFGGDLRHSGRARPTLDGAIFDLYQIRDGAFQIILIGDPGQPYAIQSTEDFLSWKDVEEVNSANGAAQVVDPEIGGRRIYRGREE